MARFSKGTTDHDGDGKKGGSKKAAPKVVEVEKADRLPEYQYAFNQGRHARANGIGRDDAPHGDGPMLENWRDGWDFA